MIMTTELARRPLPESLRAIEAGDPLAEWSTITNGECETGCLGYDAQVYAAHADIEWGGIPFAGVVEPLRSLPGYLWLVANPDENAALGHGIAPTLAEAKAAVEAAAADLATAMLTEGVSR